MHCWQCGDQIASNDLFWTIQIGIYECKICHNADIQEPETENKDLVTAFIYIVLIIVVGVIIYKQYF